MYFQKLPDDPRLLMQRVLQITEILNMYRAELARVLHLRCAEIGEMANGRMNIEPGTVTWQQARLFVRFFELFYNTLADDEVAMCLWLRVNNVELAGTPLLLIVDDDKLVDVVRYLEVKSL